MTYLMFIKDLDDSDTLRAKEAAMLGLSYKSIFANEVVIGDRKVDGNQLKWSTFHDFPAQKMYSVVQEWVFPFVKTLHGDKNSAYSKYMDDAIFKVNTPLMLSKIVDAMDEIYLMMNELHQTDVRDLVWKMSADADPNPALSSRERDLNSAEIDYLASLLMDFVQS